MHINQLKYLADLAKTGSMNLTAKRMFISQPALSESVKRLEQELGCTLLIRSKTGIEFTDDGRMVLEHAQIILEQYEGILHKLQEKCETQHLRGEVKVGVGPTISDTLLPTLMLRMHQKYPDITISVLEDAGDVLVDHLIRGELDFVLFGMTKFSYNSMQIEDFTEEFLYNNLFFKKLYEDPLVCVMAKNHPASGQKEITQEQLEQLKQTMYGTDIACIAEDQALHVSNNARIHQQFMLEEGTVCAVPYQAYLTHYASKGFLAKAITDSEPIYNYLICQKDIEEEEDIIYQAFLKTVDTQQQDERHCRQNREHD